MSGQPPFDPVRDAPLLSAYVDGELEPADVARVEAHLAADAAARAEVEKLRQLNRLTAGLRLREAPAEDWEAFWQSAYNRAERGLGWVLLLVGIAVAGLWGVARAAIAIFASTLPLVVKLGLVAAAVGTLVLLVSVLRERLFTRRHTRYDDIVR